MSGDLDAAGLVRAGAGATDAGPDGGVHHARLRVDRADACRVPRRLGAGGRVEAIGLGVAGVVTRHIARLTNVPWVVDARAIADRFRIRPPLAAQRPRGDGPRGARPRARRARRPAGGCGGAGRQRRGDCRLARASARRCSTTSTAGSCHHPLKAVTPTSRRGRHGRSSSFRISCGSTDARYEQVISGQGIVNLTRFTHASRPCPASSIQDPIAIPAAVTESALAKRCCQCMEVLDIFVSVYGAEAGNLALRSLATGGLYVGGGIALKIMPALEDGRFLDALRSKGPMTDLMATIPGACDSPSASRAARGGGQGESE